MYEFQLTDRLNRTVQDLCWKYCLGKVSKIIVKVGGLRKINPEIMSFIFAVYSKGTPAEGASLSVMILPAAFKCYACGRTWTTCDDAEFQCPYCHSRNVDLESGLELAVDFIEAESAQL